MGDISTYKKECAQAASHTERSRKFHQISVLYCEDAVHIKNDLHLKDFLKWRLSNAEELAKYIKWSFKKQNGETLRITTISLAVEILGHFILQELFLRVKKAAEILPWHGPVLRFADWMIGHMDVIDCGGKESDNNRFVWDFLSLPFRRKKVR